MEYTLEALGLVIKDLRRPPVNLTQAGLGQRAGYGEGAGAGVSISRVESGLTKPGPDRFAGIAVALGLTPGQLEAAAAQKAMELAKDRGEPQSAPSPFRRDEPIKDRVRRIQRIVDDRTSVITDLASRFDAAHERARDEFVIKFVDIAAGVTGAPQPDDVGAEETVDDEGPAAKATNQIRFNSFGVAHLLAAGIGGGAAGAAAGGVAAYGTFLAVASLGTASTGTAIAGLSGVAASNAALALLGGGTLAAGGAGVAGGTMLLVGIVAAPALVLAAGGLIWMVKRNRKQQEELSRKLNEADIEIAASEKSYKALKDILERSIETLDYIAIHGGHALTRWIGQLGPRPVDWNTMSPDQQQHYQGFVEVAASQLSIVGIDVQTLMVSRGAPREQLIELADQVLEQTESRVRSLV